MADLFRDEVLVVSESSESSDDEAYYQQTDFTIKGDILEAKRLLDRAEGRSDPRNSDYPLPRYGLSGRVSGRDLLRNRDFAEIVNIFTTLKSRLSAERIFNLGPPQNESEQLVFDDLLYIHTAESLIETAPSQDNDGARNNREANENAIQDNAGESSALSIQARIASVAQSTPATNAETTSQTVVPVPDEGNLSSWRNESSNNTTRELISGNPSIPSSSTMPSSNSHSTPPLLLSPKDLQGKLLKLKAYLNSNLSENVNSNDTVPSEITNLLQELVGASSQIDETLTPSKRKRQREEDLATPGSSKKSKLNESVSDEDEEASCSICFELWSSGGDHRICCLKCGHLFGMSCIIKWIEQARSCPQCKVPAKKSDIRSVFARKLTVEDTSQRDRVMRMLEEERQAKRTLEHKEALARKNFDDLLATNTTLRSRMARLESEVSSSGSRSADICGASGSGETFDPTVNVINPGSSQGVPTKKYHPLTRVNISQEGTCRVFEFNSDLGMAVVSAKSSNPLFRGFGIKTLSRDFRCLSYQPLHSAAIRDMSFRPATFDGTLLSCGMDRAIQLTSVTSKCVIQKYTVTGSAWCCAWNTRDTHLFYVGMERGVVKEFDIRRTDSHVQDVVQLGGAPITSLRYWNGVDQEPRFQGLLIAHVRDLIFKGKTDGNFSTHLLHSTSASIVDMNLHSSGLFMVSTRPGGGNIFCKHEVCNLTHSVSDDSDDIAVNSQRVSTWDGSNLQAVLSRNTLFNAPEMTNHILAATANHSANTVNLWDVSRKQPFQILNCNEKALDIKPIHCNNQDLLGVLCESDLVLYKWR